MAFRTILIEQARKVNLDLNSIVVNYDNTDFNINLDEISTIIFDDPMCLISLKLISKLCEKGISVLFTDYSHNPIGMINSLNNNVRATKKIYNQINWQETITTYLWTEIVKQKIKNQIITLRRVKKKDKIALMIRYLSEVENNDLKNREGLASRTYFKELFGKDFKRFDEEIINYCLNYCYQIVRSKISQEIVSSGYNTEIGINHCSEYNYFNLSDDFIEPYRPIIDYYVYQVLVGNEEEYLTPKLKRKLTEILNYNITYNFQQIKLHISIQFYVQYLFSFLETGDIGKIIFPLLE